jgi:RWD domain
MVFKVKVAAQATDEAIAASIDLLFQHTPMYPQDQPHLKISNTRGLTGADVAALQHALDTLAAESAGMPCVYDVLQAAQEWLERKAGLQQGTHSYQTQHAFSGRLSSAE